MEKSNQVIRTEKCKSCGKEIPVNPGYITWCDKCGWNINPHETDSKKEVRYKIYKFLGRKLSLKLLNSLKAKDPSNHSFSFSRLLAILLASLIYAVSLGTIFSLCGFGIYLIINGIRMENFYNGFAFVIFGIVMLLLAYFIIPKYKKSEKDYAVRQEFKTLFTVMDKIADLMKTKRIDKINFSEEFNATFYQTFLKGERILSIGLPLFYILSGEERVAVLSHELAHGANIDVSRSRYMGGAFHVLSNWYRIIYPGVRIGDVGIIAVLGPLMYIVYPLRWILSKLLLGLLYIYAMLLWRDSQRSEYLADSLASNVAGTGSMTGLLRKLHYGDSFWSLINHIYHYGYSKDFLSEYAKKVAVIPERELQRIEVLNTDFLSSVDATHPPTKYRIDLMESHFKQAKLVLTDDEIQQLETEIDQMKSRINEKLLILCKCGE